VAPCQDIRVSMVANMLEVGLTLVARPWGELYHVERNTDCKVLLCLFKSVAMIMGWK
jgi:hypothetical protein